MRPRFLCKTWFGTGYVSVSTDMDLELPGGTQTTLVWRWGLNQPIQEKAGATAGATARQKQAGRHTRTHQAKQNPASIFSRVPNVEIVLLAIFGHWTWRGNCRPQPSLGPGPRFRRICVCVYVFWLLLTPLQKV